MSQPQSRTNDSPVSQGPADFDAFLAKLSERDRGNIVRQLSAFEAESRGAHAKLFRRLAATLAFLAPQGLQTKGQRAIQFFIADGKYRLQLFALEDPHDDTLNIYLRDTIKEALKAKVLGPLARTENDINYYRVSEKSADVLQVEPLTADKTTGAPDYYRHMLGWNRTAVRITLRATSTDAEISAAESLCALAASLATKGAAPAPAAPAAAAAKPAGKPPSKASKSAPAASTPPAAAPATPRRRTTPSSRRGS
jgi:hypothetical protein